MLYGRWQTIGDGGLCVDLFGVCRRNKALGGHFCGSADVHVVDASLAAAKPVDTAQGDKCLCGGYLTAFTVFFVGETAVAVGVADKFFGKSAETFIVVGVDAKTAKSADDLRVCFAGGKIVLFIVKIVERRCYDLPDLTAFAVGGKGLQYHRGEVWVTSACAAFHRKTAVFVLGIYYLPYYSESVNFCIIGNFPVTAVEGDKTPDKTVQPLCIERGSIAAAENAVFEEVDAR